ncbi:hypothetical protein ACFQ1E_00870 [Sphingomonas canadensis]|uniref:Lipoprotein n=1 Tax=Sphingomonas canadensis TaxID=1219257 RepID=A0ABW3H1Y9_9SPHN|nr:hypothetical protein [Sphingomonas canadensis]MCW3835207.1 hypothetical protein [Sphingomonas canadensis]
MIGRIAAAALLFLAAGCAPAKPVDLSAAFAREDGGSILVEAAEGGDARAEADGRVYLVRGGREYVILSDAAGSFAARAEDYAALLAERAAAAKAGPSGEPDYDLNREDATDLIAGVRGTKWRVHPRHTPSLNSAQAVISTDPTLAPAARALALQARLTVAENSVGEGGPGKLARAMLALFDKGFVLRMGDALKLDRIDAGPIAAIRFELPGAPLGRDALRARLAASPAS